MNEDQLKIYKQKLEQEQGSIAKEVQELEKPVSFGTDVDHGDEETDQSEDEGNRLAAAQGLKDRLNEINIALGKIQTGNYGVCETCGKPIEHEILDIDPESRFCKSDKAEK